MTMAPLACAATSIGASAARSLDRGKVGFAHSVFSRAINFVTEGGMVCLVRSDVGRGPLNVVLDFHADTSLDTLGVREGMRIRKKKGILDVGPRVVSVRMERCEEYICEPSSRGLMAASQAAENLVVLKKQILISGNTAGLGALLPFFDEGFGAQAVAPLSPAAVAAFPPLLDLIRGLESSRLDGLKSAATNLVGLGPGLTPAADDVLAGLMIALLSAARALGLDEEFVRAANLSICSVVEGRTTLLSKELLELAGKGEGGEYLLGLANLVLSGTPLEVESAARRELKTGATSGTDAALGVYLGARAGLRMAAGSSR